MVCMRQEEGRGKGGRQLADTLPDSRCWRSRPIQRCVDSFDGELSMPSMASRIAWSAGRISPVSEYTLGRRFDAISQQLIQAIARGDINGNVKPLLKQLLDAD